MKGPAAALALAALAAAGLGAQSVDFGAQVTLAKPVMDVDGGSWFKGRGAVGFGLMAPFLVSRNHALVPRLDVLDLKAGPVNLVSGDNAYRLYTERAKVQLRSLGMDYDYFFRSEEEGGYLGCGLAYAQARFTGQTLVNMDAGVAPSAWTANQTKQSLQYALQTGWKFNPFLGCEFRFTQGDYKGVAAPGTIVKAPVFALSLTAEF